MKTASKKTKAPLVVDMTIPVKQLIDAPFNHRKTFIDSEIEIIADSMKIHGVLQPLAVRLAPDHKPGAPMYQVLSGGKRLLAAIRAGLKVVPCRVHDGPDDQQAKAISLVANLHSAPSPLEKGAGIRELMGQHSLTAAAAAELLGESVSAIRALIALKNLPELAETALKEGRLPIATAGLIAGIPTAEQRERLTLAVLTGNSSTEPRAEELEGEYDPLTFVETKELIAWKYMRQLKGCAWDLKDKTLHPDGLPCTTCPKRAGNAVKTDPDAYAGLRADMCLDTVCYGIKANATKTHAIAAAEAAGIKTLTGYLASQVGLFNSAYLFLDHENKSLPFALPNATTLREFLADMKVELAGVMLAVNDDGLSREIVNASWALRMVAPAAPSPAPSPKGKEQGKPRQVPLPVHFEKPAEESPSPEEPAEDTRPKLMDTYSAEERAASLAMPAALAALENLFSGISVGEGITRVLRAAALAWVEREISDYHGEELEGLEEEYGIKDVKHAEDEEVLAAWNAWIRLASASKLIGLLTESPIRWALRCLPATRSAPAVLDAAGLNWDEFLAEARKMQEPATVAS